MSLSAILSLTIVYPLMLLGDGCVIIAIALVATTGGNPWICGGAFAFFHALYSVVGLLLATEIANYSETLGSFIVLIGSAILLKHFLHHRLHHISHGDCSCEDHHLVSISTTQMISTAAALSIHALAAGPIVRQFSGIHDAGTLIPVLLVSSLVVGLLISLVVLFGERRRSAILKALDRLPGVVTTALSGLTCYALFHLLDHVTTISQTFSAILISSFILASCYLGYWIHCRTTAPSPVQITRAASKTKGGA